MPVAVQQQGSDPCQTHGKATPEYPLRGVHVLMTMVASGKTPLGAPGARGRADYDHLSNLPSSRVRRSIMR